MLGLMAQTNEYRCFVGTYTRNTESRGIYQAVFDPALASISISGSTDFKENPSFLAADEGSKRLFSVQEIAGDRTGMISMFSVGTKGFPRSIEHLGSASSGGRGPCHLLYNAARGRVVAANYASGAVGVLAVRDGSTIETVQQIQHKGSSVNKRRQEGPHAHSVTADPTGSRVIVCDLGLDEVIVYAWKSDGTLDEEPVCRASVPPGGGPRHFAFHPNRRYGYVANEMGNTATWFDYDPDSGKLTPRDTVGTLPDGFEAENTTADIHMNRDGSRLYVSNRGHDSVAVFDIDGGAPVLRGHIPTHGATPRNFALTSDDRFLFAANQDGNSITVFDLGAADGIPKDPVATLSIPKPVCVLFAFG